MLIKHAIVGSRDFVDLDFVKRYVHHLSIKHEDDQLIIISGGARGVDDTAVHEAEKLGLGWDVIEAAWEDLSHPDAVIKTTSAGKKYDAMAGFRRNTIIADVCDRLTAFWDGESEGTRDVMGKAKERQKLYDLFIRR